MIIITTIIITIKHISSMYTHTHIYTYMCVCKCIHIYTQIVCLYMQIVRWIPRWIDGLDGWMIHDT